MIFINIKCPICNSSVSLDVSVEQVILAKCRKCGSDLEIKTKGNNPQWFKQYEEGELLRYYADKTEPKIHYNFVNALKEPFYLKPWNSCLILMTGLVLGLATGTFFNNSILTIAFLSIPMAFVMGAQIRHDSKVLSHGYFIAVLREAGK